MNICHCIIYYVEILNKSEFETRFSLSGILFVGVIIHFIEPLFQWLFGGWGALNGSYKEFC